MKLGTVVLGLALVVSMHAAPAAETSAATATAAAAAAARALLAQQQADWNRGDIDAFMHGYWNDPSLRFAGADAIRTGWQDTIGRYRKTYPDAAAMGNLDFDLVEVRALSPAVVYVFGRWRLTRAAADVPDQAPEAAPHGLFTLIVEKKGGRWVVTRDHTSSASEH